MANNKIHLVTIKDANAPFFYPWLDLYETAFPPGEKMLVSTILKMLKKCGDYSRHHFVAITEDKDEFAGMMLYETNPQEGLALLWYLAIHPDRRCKGLGSVVYQELIRLLDPAVYKALFYEVEIPGEGNREEAERRIVFYQRNGAFVLEGIHYLQYIGWHHPPTQMHIMVHPLQPMNAEQAFSLAKIPFEDALEQHGTLSLR